MGNVPPVPGSCTKLLRTAKIFKDKATTLDFLLYKEPQDMYQLHVTYTRPNPKQEGSGIGIQIGRIYMTDETRTSFTKTKVYEYDTEDEAKKVIKELREGMCLKCGNTTLCEKELFNVDKWNK